MNAAHIDNFKSYEDNRVAIFDVTEGLYGTKWFEIASGDTIEEAKERFYKRYMIRGALDQTELEIIVNAQRYNRLFIMQVSKGHANIAIERHAQLIAL